MNVGIFIKPNETYYKTPGLEHWNGVLMKLVPNIEVLMGFNSIIKLINQKYHTLSKSFSALRLRTCSLSFCKYICISLKAHRRSDTSSLQIKNSVLQVNSASFDIFNLKQNNTIIVLNSSCVILWFSTFGRLLLQSSKPLCD